MEDLKKLLHKANELVLNMCKEQEKRILLLSKVECGAAKISDMPKGNRVGNSIEDYAIKVDEIDRKLSRIQLKIDDIRIDVEMILKEIRVKEHEKYIIISKFFVPLSWSEVACEVCDRYNMKINKNMAYGIYKKILKKYYKTIDNKRQK